MASFFSPSYQSTNRAIFGIILALLLSGPILAQTPQIVLGSSQIQASLDTNSVGMAEAFPVTALSSGQVNFLSLFLDSSNTAGTIAVGLYTNYYGHPNRLLSQALLQRPAAGRWNSVQIPAVQVTQGRRYWLAVLGLSGRIQFRDANSSWCHSETSRRTGLTSLPDKWWTGSQYSSCLVSMFGSGNTVSTVSVTLSPTSASLQPSQQRQFTATVSGTTNTGVTWVASGGTVTSSGMYTAPSTAGTYIVTATSLADSTKSASASVAVSQPSQISISLSPTSATLQTSGQQQFAAYVSGTSNTAVTWKANGGTVTSAGLYTAPTTAGNYTVTAVSAADGTTSASALVSVSAPQNVAITISPTTVSMPAKWQQQFSDIVSGSTNTGVTWAVSQGTGTITQSGLYTAPQVAETDVVTVISQADTTKSASATVSVAAPHSVTLSWSPSPTTGVTYNVYRGTTNGGPYSLLSSGLSSTSYKDMSVQSGSTYYYVTTAVGSGGQSPYSNVAQAVIPMP